MFPVESLFACGELTRSGSSNVRLSGGGSSISAKITNLLAVQVLKFMLDVISHHIHAAMVTYTCIHYHI
jgi:hypothetical protein